MNLFKPYPLARFFLPQLGSYKAAVAPKNYIKLVRYRIIYFIEAEVSLSLSSKIYRKTLNGLILNQPIECLMHCYYQGIHNKHDGFDLRKNISVKSS